MEKLKAYKVEIAPTEKQKEKIKQSQGTLRFIWNLYVGQVTLEYKQAKEKGMKYLVPNDSKFYKWINEEYIPEHNATWIKETHNKSIKEVLRVCYQTYQNAFKGKCNFPRFKKKSESNDPSLYFVKNDKNTFIISNRHYVKVPGFGRIHLKEKGRIPTLTKENTDQYISSGRLEYKSGKYYIVVLVKTLDAKPVIYKHTNKGVGIDLGIKSLAYTSDGVSYKNITKAKKYKKIQKKIKRKQRAFSRKLESYKKRKETTEGYPTTSNLDKNRKEIAKLYARKTRIKNDYIWKMCIDILKDNPEYIVLEDLNIKGMMKNKNLAKTIAECSWYRIKQTLIYLCNERGIEVRIVDRYYPSSKTCHTCGHKKEDLKLKDRIYVCKECGEVLDRDYNASLNLRDAKKYTIVK